MTRTLFALTSIAILAAWFQVPAEAGKESKLHPDEVAVRALVDQHVKAVRTGDAKALAKVWDGQGRLTYRNGRVVIRTQRIADATKRLGRAARPALRRAL